MSSLAKRYRLGGAGRPESGDLMPPDPRTLGTTPFDEPQRVRLAAWLREGGWPRGHMDIAELEGFLVALVVWPVGISAGAWLPPVWGGRGWRVPEKIAARPRFEEFVALIVGFMRELDCSLSRPSSRFESSVLRGLASNQRAHSLHRWGKGFMMALTLGSQGLMARNASARAAVQLIAGNTSASAPFGPFAVEEVVGAVMTLLAERSSRGPLGPLDATTAA
jgi:yecA family protein